MLSLLRLHYDNSNKTTSSQSGSSLKIEGSLLGLINGFISYIKNIKIFDAVLPPAPPKKETEQEEGNLFPTKIRYDHDILKDSSAMPCSTTSQPSKLLKYENIDGSITWKFQGNDDEPQQSFSDLTSPFLTSTGSTVSSRGDGFSPSHNLHIGTINSPSPMSINNHQSRLFTTDVESAHSLEDEFSQIPDLPNPEFFDVELNQSKVGSPTFSHSSTDSKDKDDSKIHTCSYCGAEFRIRGYLTRHIKKHAITKAYECPFFDKDAETPCHPNGGFSRRDTYKTHLKARHFKYPQGTKSQDRATTPGKCGLCSKPYENSEIWVENHIESGECEGLPNGFQIRIKNSRKKNYEFPKNDQNTTTTTNTSLSTPIDESSNSSSNEHDSPMSNNTTPNLHSNLKNLNEQIIMNAAKLHNETKLMGIVNHNNNITSTKSLNNQVFTQVPVNIETFNDYDDNDEYSLDVEQCSYRPIRVNNNYY